jgi:4'-phosphopantetheinyl transferase
MEPPNGGSAGHPQGAPYAVRTLTVQEAMASRPAISSDRESVQVWLIRLVATEAELAQCRDLLSPAEHARARRFRRSEDCDRYTLAHGLLRELLSRYCAARPADLQLGTAPGGKPLLLRDGGPPIAFNLSHSAERMLLAIAEGREVGVDIESVERRVDPLKLARRYFHPCELEDIERAPEREQVTRFFEYWVAKEATLKGAGHGLRFALDALRVQFTSDRRDARIDSLDPQRLASDWTVRMLSSEPGLVSAVAIRNDPVTDPADA